jgi:hypothetical protein
MDDKQASRIALYHEGAITDTSEKLAQLREWVVNAMIQLQRVIDHHVIEAINGSISGLLL